MSEFGRIDILVNSHGLTKRIPSVEFPEEDWDRIIAVNLKGVFLCCQRVGRVMIKQQRGSDYQFRLHRWARCRADERGLLR